MDGHENWHVFWTLLENRLIKSLGAHRIFLNTSEYIFHASWIMFLWMVNGCKRYGRSWEFGMTRSNFNNWLVRLMRCSEQKVEMLCSLWYFEATVLKHVAESPTWGPKVLFFSVLSAKVKNCQIRDTRKDSVLEQWTHKYFSLKLGDLSRVVLGLKNHVSVVYKYNVYHWKKYAKSFKNRRDTVDGHENFACFLRKTKLSGNFFNKQTVWPGRRIPNIQCTLVFKTFYRLV